MHGLEDNGWVTAFFLFITWFEIIAYVAAGGVVAAIAYIAYDWREKKKMPQA